MRKWLCTALVAGSLLSGCGGSAGQGLLDSSFTRTGAGLSGSEPTPSNQLVATDDDFFLLGNTIFRTEAFAGSAGLFLNDIIADPAQYLTLPTVIFNQDLPQSGSLGSRPDPNFDAGVDFSRGNTDATFSYFPNAGFRGTDQMSYYIVQQLLTAPSVGRISVNPGRVRFHVGPVAWFVENTRTDGTGTQDAPFPTLAQAVAASQANDVIFIKAGDGTSKGLTGTITLKPGQRLMGEGVGLKVNVAQGQPLVINPTSGPILTLVEQGTPARLPGPVVLANDCTVEGLNFQGTPGSALTANGAKNVAVRSNIFGGGSGPVLRLDACTGILSFTGNTVGAAAADGLNCLQLNQTSGTSTLDLSSNTFADGSSVDPADVIALDVSGGASVVAKVDKNNLSSPNTAASFDRFMVVGCQSSSSVTINADQNILPVQVSGVSVTNSSNLTSNFIFTKNTITATEDGITVDGGGVGTVGLRCNQNNIVVNETGDPGDPIDGYSCIEVKGSGAFLVWEFLQNNLTGGTDGIFALGTGGFATGLAQGNVLEQQQFHPLFIRTFGPAINLLRVLSNTFTNQSNDGMVLTCSDNSTLTMAVRDNQGVVFEATEILGAFFCLDMTGNTFDRAVLLGEINVERLDLSDNGPLDAVNTFTTSLTTTGPLSVPVGTCGL